MNAVINPYSEIPWETILHIPSLSHAHSRVWQNHEEAGADIQKYIDRANEGGIIHAAFSNYYPSEPFYPLDEWFVTVPSGMIGSPNAEHHSFTDPMMSDLHVNSLGSFYSSGHEHDYSPAGTNSPLRKIFPLILDELQYADSGGITINHPVWSNIDSAQILPMLRFDPRVLGIEIANSWMISSGGECETTIWDELLMMGQRCWGFCVPDHGVEWSAHFSGRNILLVDEIDEHKCLKAYRDGNFYSKLFDSDLSFASISFDGTALSVSAPLADSIKIVVNKTTYSFDSNTASMNIPSNAIYCRAEAWMDYDWINRYGQEENVTEKIFSNPIMFVNSKYSLTCRVLS